MDTYVPEAERTAVKKILFGLNQGKLVEKLEIPSAAAKIAKDNDFDITLSKFEAGPDGRPPRVCCPNARLLRLHHHHANR